MDVACEECGDVGVKDLLLHCSNCKSASRHRYCLDVVIYDLSIVEWWCNGCLPKHNESVKSLEGISNQMQTNTQLDSSIINESNVKKEKVTNGLWSWGHHRNRSRKGRKDQSNASKHLLSGATFNWEYLINRSHEARRDSSDACPKQLRSGEASNSCEMFIGEMSKRNDSEKKREDQNEHLIGALESVDGSSECTLDHDSETEEHTNFQKPMGGFKSTLNSTELPDLLKEKHSCSLKYVDGSIPQQRNGYLLSLINDAERSPLMIGDKSRPTLASVEQADGSSPILAIAERFNALKVVNGLVCKQKGVLASKFPSKHSNPMQGSDLKTGNADVLNPSKGCLDSWSKVAESSLPSNEWEDLTVEENSTETKCLADEEIVTPTLENCRGSNPSMSKGCLVSNEGNSGEADRRSDEHLSNTKDKRMRRHMSGEVHCDDPSERGNSCKVNEISNPKSAEGDQDGNNLKCNAGRTSSPAGKKVVRKQALQVEGVNINSESLSSKYVSPCESTKINPRSRHQSNSYTPHETKYQKAKLIKKHESVNASRSKSGTPAVSLKDNENMPGKDNHSNGKVIESSKLGEDKKMDKSWLANKTSSDLQKRGIVTNVLQPSSLHKSSVDKSRPLNNRRNSCARRVTEVDQIRLSRKFDPTNSDALLEACSKTKIVHEANNTEPKKRRRLILPNDEDEDEDVEVMQVEDLNPRSCDNDARVKKQRRYRENGVKNQRKYVEKSDEALKPGNLNRRSSKNHKQVKKQRSIKRNEDENAGVGKLNAGCAQNDVSQFALQTAAEDNCGLSRRPLISEYICVQPVDKPYWTGIMKIGGDYIPLAAHLSTKAGKRVHEFSRSLPPIIKVTEHSTSKSCPKYLEALKPTVDNINLYFFSGDMRPNKELDQLVKHVAGHGIVLETVVGLAKLLLFPSVALPDEYQMFQGKHYLLGVFQPRKDKRKVLAPVEQDCTAHVTEEKQIQEQHVLDQPDQTSSHDTMDQEMPLANQVMHSENQPLPLLDANGGLGKESVSGNGPSSDMKDLVSANISSADHGQPCSDSEVPPLKLCGFVVSRTQRSAQLIQEMQKEGALLFAVPQVLTEPVSLA